MSKTESHKLDADALTLEALLGLLLRSLCKECEIYSPRIKAQFRDELRRVSKGTLELNKMATSYLWGRMFEEGNMIFLRATSLIPPEMWKYVFMVRYEQQQRETVQHLSKLRLDESREYESLVRNVESKLRSSQSGNSEFYVDWFNRIKNVNFQRTFIILREQLTAPGALAELALRVASQSSFMNVRLTYEMKIPPENVKDFAVAISKDGGILVYDLRVISGVLYGGRITYDPLKIRDFISMYMDLDGVSIDVRKDSKAADILKEITNLVRGSKEKIAQSVLKQARTLIAKQEATTAIQENEAVAILEERDIQKMGKNICAACFVETELTMGNMKEMDLDALPSRFSWIEAIARTCNKDWHGFPSERRCWYEMIKVEKEKIVEYVKKHEPRRIIEVGCGTGRVISYILKMKGYKDNDKYAEMAGWEKNRLMWDIANYRFRNYPKIKFFCMEVKDELPYANDYFDLCVNAMNIVGWQENEKVWLKEMLRCSKTVFFTLYKKRHEKERREMYETRGHLLQNVTIDEGTGQIRLRDSATSPGVLSKAYKSSEVKRICQEVASRFEPEYNVTATIDSETSKLLHLCFLSKKKSEPEREPKHPPIPFKPFPFTVPTKFGKLDMLLNGGLPENYAVILMSPPSPQRDLIVKSFLRTGAKNGETTFILTKNPSKVRDLAREFQSNFSVLTCSGQVGRIVSDLPNEFRLEAGISNLTHINIAFEQYSRDMGVSEETVRRACIDIVSAAVIRHNVNKTVQWLRYLLERLQARGFTTLAVIDPGKHDSKDVQALLDLFNGEIEIDNEGLLRIRRMDGWDFQKDPVVLESGR